MRRDADFAAVGHELRVAQIACARRRKSQKAAREDRSSNVTHVRRVHPRGKKSSCVAETNQGALPIPSVPQQRINRASVGQKWTDAQGRCAPTGAQPAESGGQGRLDAQASYVSALCSQIVALHRPRMDLVRQDVSLVNAIKAKCRRLVCSDDPRPKPTKQQIAKATALYKSMMGGGRITVVNQRSCAAAHMECLPFVQAHAMIHKQRRVVEKQIEVLVKDLPIVAWVKAVRGFGLGNLGSVIGETGDFANYANPAKVWKRLGLAVINGERQRKVAGCPALAIQHGYSPRRRAVAAVLGDCVQKAQGKKGAYGRVYYERKAYEKEQHPELTKGHAHRRALRYMEKRLIRDLWRAWRAS